MALRKSRIELAQKIHLTVGVARPGSYAKVYGSDNSTLCFQDIPSAVATADAGLEGFAYTVLPDDDVGPCIDVDLPRELDQAIQTTLKAVVAARGRRAALHGSELAAVLPAFGPSIEIQRWMITQLRSMYDRVSREQGATAAVLPSGRGAHLLPVGLGLGARKSLRDHVARLQQELRRRLVEAGLPETEAAFEIKSYCRPPGSPHRFEGDLGIVLYPLPGVDEHPQWELLDFLAERGQQRIE